VDENAHCIESVNTTRRHSPPDDTLAT